DEEVAKDLMNDAAKEPAGSQARTLYVSAVEGTGLDALLARIDAMIEEDRVSRVRLRVPQSEGKLLALVEARSRIVSRKYQEGIVMLELDAPESVLRRVSQFVVPEKNVRRSRA